jgi:hypothetical protein
LQGPTLDRALATSEERKQSCFSLTTDAAFINSKRLKYLLYSYRYNCARCRGMHIYPSAALVWIYVHYYYDTITRTEAKNIKSDDPLSSSLYDYSHCSYLLPKSDHKSFCQLQGVWGVDTYYLPVSKHRSSLMLGAVSVRTLVNNLKDSQALHLFSLMFLLAISRSADSDLQDAEAVITLAENHLVLLVRYILSNGSFAPGSPSVLVRRKGPQIHSRCHCPLRTTPRLSLLPSICVQQ